ncbi:unnamed protein product [Clonostachys rhizophaga]|uniref:Uncharacterized protein n=1 Tax=Clonostachys rhizophaga TaxID=160324 RepID=A0A9N9VWQ4_9HYPO|nr:unnamed protein product [Clonostachys rhizophaga]
MHFTKTLVSIFALASFTSAFSYEADEEVSALAAREAEFLQARDDYIQARDNYLIEKRGGFISKPSGAAQGVCAGSARPYTCMEKLINGKSRNCGPCKSSTGFGKKCECSK